MWRDRATDGRLHGCSRVHHSNVTRCYRFREQRWSRGFDAGGFAGSRSFVGGGALAAAAALAFDAVGVFRLDRRVQLQARRVEPDQRRRARGAPVAQAAHATTAARHCAAAAAAVRRPPRDGALRDAFSAAGREASGRHPPRSRHRGRADHGARLPDRVPTRVGRAAPHRRLPRRVPRIVGVGPQRASRSRAQTVRYLPRRRTPELAFRRTASS